MRRRQSQLLYRIAAVSAVVVVLATVAWWQRTFLLKLIPTPPVVVTEQNNDGSVYLLQGQRLEVRLRGNRYSGRWTNNIPLPFLQATGEVTFTQDSAGASGEGYQSTIFLATGPGRGPLFMGYVPSSDQNSMTPSKSFRIVVVVR